MFHRWQGRRGFSTKCRIFRSIRFRWGGCCLHIVEKSSRCQQTNKFRVESLYGRSYNEAFYSLFHLLFASKEKLWWRFDIIVGSIHSEITIYTAGWLEGKNSNSVSKQHFINNESHAATSIKSAEIKGRMDIWFGGSWCIVKHRWLD